MNIQITAIGALIGLILAIILIIKKIHPVYCLMLGAFVGGTIGGAGMSDTISVMFEGAQGMVPSVLRILTSGILAGALMKTGSAEKIAEVIVHKLGRRWSLLAVALATMTLCAIGVFVDITIITVAPIGLAVGKKSGFNDSPILLAMIGGGKAGNVISPNPNTIVTAEVFQVDLIGLMMKNLIPAVAALVITVLLAYYLASKSYGKEDNFMEKKSGVLPTFWAAACGPFVVVSLLSLRPIFNIGVDPMIALPIGGVVCCIATGNGRQLKNFCEFGLKKVIGVAILLVGTGTIAGVVGASDLQLYVIKTLEYIQMPAFLLAPISGILMAGATASTTAGTTIAAQTFGNAILHSGVSAMGAAAMLHAGATVLDSLPHGSFFHATGGCMNMNTSQRLKLIPYEACVGLTTTIIAAFLYLLS